MANWWENYVPASLTFFKRKSGVCDLRGKLCQTNQTQTDLKKLRTQLPALQVPKGFSHETPSQNGFRLERGARREQKGVFVIARDLFHSPAFESLAQKHPTHLLVLLEVFDQLNLEPQAKRSVKRKRGFKNGGVVALPQNRLKAAGVKSVTTQSVAKRRLVELGFLDVVSTVCLTEYTEFRISDRWRSYPDVRPQKDPKPISKPLYPEKTL